LTRKKISVRIRTCTFAPCYQNLNFVPARLRQFPDCRSNLRAGQILIMTKCSCIRCCYKWESKLSRPSSCPKCCSADWDKPRKRLPNGETFKVFLKMLKRETDQCVVWPYSKGGQMGYGRIYLPTKQMDYTHRQSWKQRRGEIPYGLQVLHTCDNPPCFNPRHLFLGTCKDNAEDAANKKRTCIGEKNAMSKLSELEVLSIRELYHHGVRGLGQIEMARKFGVTKITIRKIIKRITWRHI